MALTEETSQPGVVSHNSVTEFIELIRWASIALLINLPSSLLPVSCVRITFTSSALC